MDPEAHADEPHPSSSFSSASSSFAFASYSQDHLPSNVPQPSSDNSSFIRRRRRRTSPHDQVILEEEYRKCTKPDKIRRKEICKRVQMGEKEVQIWFCNKRQAERRRATPLQPHEMVPNRERSFTARGHGHHDPTAAIRGTSFALELPTSLASSPPGLVSRTRTHLNHHREFPSEISVPSSSGVISSSPCVAYNVKSRLAIDDDDRYLHSDIRDRDIAFCSDSEREAELPILKPGMAISPGEPLASLKPLVPPGVLKTQESQEQLNPLGTQAPNPATNKPASKIKPLFQAPKPVSTGAKTTTSAHRRLQDALNTNPQPQAQPTVSHANFTADPPAPHPRRTKPTTVPPLLRRSSSSLLRLATNMDGKAVVVLASPEPPSPPPSRLLMHPDRPPTTTPKKRSSSRPPIDTKLWEFACENQRGILSPSTSPPLPDEASYAVRLMRNRNRMRRAEGKAIGGPVGDVGAGTGGLGVAGPSNNGGVLPTPKKCHSHHHHHHHHHHPNPPKFSSKKRPADTSLESDKENRPPGVPVSPPVELCQKKRKGKVTSHADEIRRVLGAANVDKLKRKIRAKETEENRQKGKGKEKERDGDKEKENGSTDTTGKGENIWNDRRIDEIECVENLLSLQRGSWR
ncbi:hypothetical protein BZA77DRAFT_372503 [Pyronema omphalodes]|nr:hypothetical protein BZA77DRAFT_372503 [Pyronema omphalodes]